MEEAREKGQEAQGNHPHPPAAGKQRPGAGRVPRLPSPALTQQEETRLGSPARLLFHTLCCHETSRDPRATEPGLPRKGPDPPRRGP